MKGKKLIGALIVLFGLILLVMPNVLPASFVSAIGGTHPVVIASQNVYYIIKNDIVSMSKPFEMGISDSVPRDDRELSTFRLRLTIGDSIVGYCEIWQRNELIDARQQTVASDCQISLSNFSNFSGKQTLRLTREQIPNSGAQHQFLFVGDVEVWVDASECELKENSMVVAETFTAGRTLALQDMRFPVKGFCSSLPILVTQEGRIVEQKLEEYSLLQKSYLTIPAGQTWTFFYIANLSPDIAVVCKDGVYDAGASKCVVSPPIVFSCSGDAIFDSKEMVCVSQAETRIVCDLQDAVYDTQLQKCVKIIPTEQQAVATCPLGSTAELENGIIKRCIFSAPTATSWVCESGHLNTTTTPPTCDKQANTELTTVDLTLTNLTGRSSVLMLVGIVFVIIGGIVFIRE